MPTNRRIASVSTILSIVLFSMLVNGLMLTGPLYMLQIYDRVLASGNHATLWALTILAIGALATMSCLEAVRSQIFSRIAARFEEAIGRQAFAASFAACVEADAAASRSFRDLESIRSFLGGQGLVALLDAPWVPFYLVLAFLFHPLLGFIATAGAVALFALACVNDRAARAPLRDASAELDKAGVIAESALRCFQAVAAMGMLSAVCGRWARLQAAGLARLDSANARRHAIQAASRGVRQALQIGMLCAGAALAIDGAITAGVMVVASIIMGRALSPVEQAIAHWHAFHSARAAWGRIAALLKKAPAPGPRAATLPNVQGSIEVDGVVCVPPGARFPVLRSVSFALAPGEALAVIGPSGAGKSSLVRVLTGLWRPVSGTVKIDGMRLADYPPAELGRMIGFLPQEVELLDGTIAENISRFDEAPDPAEIVRAAESAGTHELILDLPDGYDTRLHATGQTLSGGQRQRIGLARAHYGDPPIVILDEPGSNLDRDGEEALLQAIRTLKSRGKTVIVVAHRPSVLAGIDKVLMLREGRVQVFGPCAEVLPQVVPATAARQRPSLSAVGE